MQTNSEIKVLTPDYIAKYISELLGVKYTHHDLHYSDYNHGSFALLTAYPGMTLYTFSILENGEVFTPTTFLNKVLTKIDFQVYITDEHKAEHKEVYDNIEKIKVAEAWVKENNVVEILKANLSDFYKELLEKNKK